MTRLSDAILHNNLEEFKKCENLFNCEKEIILQYVINCNAFSILDYLIEKYFSTDDDIKLMMEGYEFVLVEPRNSISYEHAKFVSTKSSLDNIHANYRLFKEE